MNKIDYWTIGMNKDYGVQLNINIEGRWFELHPHDKDIKSMMNIIEVAKPALLLKNREDD